MMAPMVGSGRVCESLKSSGQFCVDSSVAMKMFSKKLIQFFYKFCTFNVIFKGNASVSCITDQHKKILVNFDGSYASTV
jgi:hypothetical protein